MENEKAQPNPFVRSQINASDAKKTASNGGSKKTGSGGTIAG